MIIALDGPAASGKSTTARLVAQRLGFRYLDTGAMYRALALAAQQRGMTDEAFASVLPSVRLDLGYDADGNQTVALDGEDVTAAIRTRDMGLAASAISRHAPVREYLVQMQQELGRRYSKEAGGAVLDGRDIGTVVFPQAELKVFVIADARTRAERRLAELEVRGEVYPDREAALDALEAELVARDRADAARAAGPLKAAPDAILLDTTELSPEEQVEIVVQHALARQ
ncbi:MAG: (d)CMP kinase [Bacteroidetes bacterium]|nr:(d)CMP kinase [Bacteroidota bacterium]